MNGLLETLPTVHRLALSYAPAEAREATLAVFALDARLADIVRSASEPMLAQIRLAWWRDMLGRARDERPAGEPLLTALTVWHGREESLAALVDGWEHLATDQLLSANDMSAFGQGRGSAFAGLASLVGFPEATQAARLAAEDWAIADLASQLSDSEERETVAALAAGREWKRIALPRNLRPLAVLHGLALRDMRMSTGSRQSALRTFFAAMRIGLSGR